MGPTSGEMDPSNPDDMKRNLLFKSGSPGTARLLSLFLLACAPVAHALGFANGIKIGEITPGSVVLWARLTAAPEAAHRVDQWTAEQPNWLVPGEQGEIRFVLRRHDDPSR